MKLSDQEFDKLISEAMDELPQEYISKLNNIAITYDDEPSAEQRKRLKLRCHETLFGLYEGTPLTKRPAASSIFSGNPMILPDKITLFKLPLLSVSPDIKTLKQQIKHTLWHEIAHYFGLDHDRIHVLENNQNP